jgi:hypothetical protein
MARFRDYTRHAASYCPNLPAVVFSRALLSAARDYFTRTQAWKETINISMVTDKSVYNLLDLFNDGIIDTVTQVILNDKPLTAVERESIDTRVGIPEYFASPTKNTIAVYPIPKESGTLQVTATLKPSIDTDFLPDDLFDEHFEGLIAGCIWQIKRMPGTDWYDPQAATNFAYEFNKFIDDKRIELAMGNNNTEIVIQYPSFV